MAQLPNLRVDLSRAPHDRWAFDDAHVRAAGVLLKMYNDDLGVDSETLAYVVAAASELIPAELLAEMEGAGSRLGASLPEVLLANLHYDMLKTVLGCTAVAIPTEFGPLHARNLDWWTTAGALSDGTVVTHFFNGPAGDFLTVGWPGFVGALSGLAINRFAITLNAVLSDEPGQLAIPIVLLIRQVLETARNFEEAVDHLTNSAIATDCLLLVTGTRNAQMVVIERTPTRHAHRAGHPGQPLRVANDYLVIDPATAERSNDLLKTSCRRFDRIGELVDATPPRDLQQCIAHLRDPDVMMGITVQQMAFHARSGKYLVEIP